MKLIPETFTQQGWRELSEQFADLSLIQTYEYAEAKARTSAWSVERVVFEEDGVVVGAAQAAVKKLPLGMGGLVWVNRAPLHLGPHTPPDALPRMLEAMRRHWVTDRRMYLRLALAVAPDDAPAELPGYRLTGASGWAAGLVDLSPDTDDMLKALRQKWRNCLYKAQRLGTEVVEGSDDAIFGRFLDAYRATLDGASYTKTTGPDLLAEMQRIVPEDRRMTVLEARTENGPVGWVLLHRYGRRAEYVAAVTTGEGRKANAGQLLLWHALTSMKSAGAAEFDVCGYDPEDRDQSGPGRFKHGLNPVPYRFAGELEARRTGIVPELIRRRVDGQRVAAGAGSSPRTLRPQFNLPTASVNAVGVTATAATQFPL